MMIIPDISVCIPVYNQEKYIKQAIESTYSNQSRIEVVVLDDGSTDNTLEILKQIKPPENITLVILEQKNTGKMGLNMDKLYSFTTGRYISELGADDFYTPSALDILVNALDSLPTDIGFVYSGHYRMKVTPKGDSNSHIPTPNLNNKYYDWINYPEKRLLENNFVTPPCALRSEIYQQVKYDKNQHLCEDYLFKLELSRITKFYKLNKHLAIIRVRDDSISNNPNAKIQMKPWEDRAREKVKERHGW